MILLKIVLISILSSSIKIFNFPKIHSFERDKLLFLVGAFQSASTIKVNIADISTDTVFFAILNNTIGNCSNLIYLKSIILNIL